MLVIVNKRRFCIAVTITAIVIISLVVALIMPPVTKAVYPLKYERLILSHSSEYDLDPYLIMGIISAESQFEADAISHKDAMGLMQIKEETAKWCIDHFELDADIRDIYEPDTNIMIGCAYIDYLTDMFEGKTDVAIAAYNAGQGNVKKWLSDNRYSDDGKTLKNIPFDETEKYVKKVRNREKIYRDLY